VGGVFDWIRRSTPRERLAALNLRPDTLEAAAKMASDPRSDRYVGELGSSLRDSETVLRIMDAHHDGQLGLLVLTSERIFFRGRRRSGALAFSVPLGAVMTIEAVTSRLLGTVRITTADRSLIADQILGTQGEMLATEAREATQSGSRAGRDPLEVLAELRALRDGGGISDTEFEIRKSELWRQI
jgi:hypothetical protein